MLRPYVSSFCCCYKRSQTQLPRKEVHVEIGWGVFSLGWTPNVLLVTKTIGTSTFSAQTCVFACCLGVGEGVAFTNRAVLVLHIATSCLYAKWKYMCEDGSQGWGVHSSQVSSAQRGDVVPSLGLRQGWDWCMVVVVSAVGSAGHVSMHKLIYLWCKGSQRSVHALQLVGGAGKQENKKKQRMKVILIPNEIKVTSCVWVRITDWAGCSGVRENLVISEHVVQGSACIVKFPSFFFYSRRNFRQLQRRAAVRPGLFC